MMTSPQRFKATVERQPVDRPASWLGMPETHALPALLAHFNAKDMIELKRKIGDDIWPIDVPYNHPPANHIACAFDFAVASAFNVPLAAGSADLATSIFAPVAGDELRRLLVAGGYYLKVIPGPRHLWSLRQGLYTNPQPHAGEPVTEQGFKTVHTRTVDYTITLDRERLADVVAMTPFAHRGHREKREALLTLSSMTLEMAFELAVLQQGGDQPDI